jgi:type I restriction enzyme R subunit
VEQGVFIEELQEKVSKELDPFDLICHIAFDMPPLTRYERAKNVKKRSYFAKYGDLAHKVFEALLHKYTDQGIEAIEEGMDDKKLVDFLRVPPFDKIGMPVQIIREFGGKGNYLKALKELEEQIYQAA